MYLMGQEAKIEAEQFDTTIRAIIRAGGGELYDNLFGEKAEEAERARIEEDVEWLSSEDIDIEALKEQLALG